MAPAGVYPHAIYRPVPQAAYAVPVTPTAVVVHSNAGTGGDLLPWWLNPAAGGVYSHFQVTISGQVFQYCPITRRAPANMGANSFAVSVETANTPGYGVLPPFDFDEWRGPQRAALIDLIRWICDTTGIPARPCIDGRTGVGGHGWFDSWTKPGHVCPGAARSIQLTSDIIPALGSPPTPAPSPSEDDMNSDQDRRLKAVEMAAASAPAAALLAGQASQRVEIVLSWMSHGGIEAGVTKIYNDLLGRDPDPAGLRAWSDAATKATYRQIRARVAASSEAKRRAAA